LYSSVRYPPLAYINWNNKSKIPTYHPHTQTYNTQVYTCSTRPCTTVPAVHMRGYQSYLITTLF